MLAKARRCLAAGNESSEYRHRLQPAAGNALQAASAARLGADAAEQRCDAEADYAADEIALAADSVASHLLIGSTIALVTR
jgi:hypothetical protein